MTLGKYKYTYNLKLNDNPIEAQDKLRILGVTLDNNLTFIPHVKEMLKRVYGKIGLFPVLRIFFLNMYYLSLIRHIFCRTLNIEVLFCWVLVRRRKGKGN